MSGGDRSCGDFICNCRLRRCRQAGGVSKGRSQLYQHAVEDRAAGAPPQINVNILPFGADQHPQDVLMEVQNQLNTN